MVGSWFWLRSCAVHLSFAWKISGYWNSTAFMEGAPHVWTFFLSHILWVFGSLLIDHLLIYSSSLFFWDFPFEEVSACLRGVYVSVYVAWVSRLSTSRCLRVYLRGLDPGCLLACLDGVANDTCELGIWRKMAVPKRCYFVLPYNQTWWWWWLYQVFIQYDD